VDDGREGVARKSVRIEQKWWATASRWQRIKRRLGAVLHWV
jgi:hypothetical protein